jgi:hypothetical protein
VEKRLKKRKSWVLGSLLTEFKEAAAEKNQNPTSEI